MVHRGSDRLRRRLRTSKSITHSGAHLSVGQARQAQVFAQFLHAARPAHSVKPIFRAEYRVAVLRAGTFR